MKKILSLKGRRYLTRIGVFLIAIALIAGLVSCEGGCDGDGDGVGVRYTLTMAANPPAGGTATDLTGGSPYLANTSVNIQAVANPGYAFANWSAPAGAFGNPAAATTTFTMPAQNVTVTANFVLAPAGKLDHFTLYDVDSTWYIWQNVTLEDQFGTFNATVRNAPLFCNPAGKSHEGDVYQIKDSDHHFTGYWIDVTGDGVIRSVEVDNQFGLQNLTVEGPYGLLVPTQKEGHAAPVGLDHYLLYDVLYALPVAVNVSLNDQWGNQTEVLVYEPVMFGTPVSKNGTPIVDPDVHLVIYDIYGGYFNKTIQVANQFGNETLNVSGPYGFLVPSEKIVPPVPKPLDHFKCYNVTDALPVWVSVNLIDQFGYYYGVDVMEAIWFCNPVEKYHEPMPAIPISYEENHLTVYNITGVSGEMWYVEVDNQFGFQSMYVYGPVAVAAPTQKLVPGDHPEPKYLDHYLLYEVAMALPVGALVDLDDEFPDNAMAVNVTYPRYFANPVLLKEHGPSFNATWDPETHLVFYDISDNLEFSPWVTVDNQFWYGTQTLNLTEGQLLAVPSVKLYYEWLP